MGKRLLAAIPAMALLFTVIYFEGPRDSAGGLYARILVAAVGVLCMHEMLDVLSKNARPMRAVGYTFAVLLFPAYQWASGLAGVGVLFAIAVMTVLVSLVFTSRETKDGMATLFALAYPGMLYAYLIAITSQESADVSRFLLLLTFISAVATDTFAYFTGRLIGRHKLAEKISPKKTIEGAAGGAFFGTLTMYLFGFFGQRAFGFHISPLWYIGLGLVLSVLAQAGDLAASKVKRAYGVKDYGKIMGAHGGAMDRLDSVMFVVPAVYAFYFFIR